MTRKLALSLAAGLTAFALILVAVVGANLFRPQATADASANSAAQVDPAAGSATAAGPSSDFNAALQAAVAERDAYYQQQLQAANSQLTEANNRLQQAYAELDQAHAATPVPASPAATSVPASAPASEPAPAAAAQDESANVPPTYAISPRRAALIALSAAPGASLSSAPSVVSFQGTPAYEVTLDSGPVYVDASTGEVLYNGAASIISSAPQPQGAGYDHDGQDENERAGDD